MKRVFWILFAAMLCVALYLLFTGPRMRIQPNIRTFQERVAPLPEGMVPVEPAVDEPSPEWAAAATNPLPATADNVARGKVYYGYYCQFCHGASGAGDGPVGQSYVPAPANLTSGKVQSYTDGELLRASLTGVGHTPVLPQVVPPEHRWYIVLFVRSLAGGPETGASAPAAP